MISSNWPDVKVHSSMRLIIDKISATNVLHVKVSMSTVCSDSTRKMEFIGLLPWETWLFFNLFEFFSHLCRNNNRQLHVKPLFSLILDGNCIIKHKKFENRGKILQNAISILVHYMTFPIVFNLLSEDASFSVIGPDWLSPSHTA